MRSMWNGMISFGLVNIPVGMYPATKSDKVRFNFLHKEDDGRISNQRVCQVCGEVIEFDDLVRGYEYEKDHYVTLTDEELDKVEPEATETITIDAFVALDEIDPIYFERPYYLVPSKKSDRAYSLLREALVSTKKVGIARFVLRTREYLAAIRPSGDMLVLDTMHFSEEIREREGAPDGAAQVNKRELEMASQLIAAMVEKFDPEKYHDTYAEALTELIDKKLEGKPIAAKATRKEPTQVGDLMSRLKASLAKSGSAAKSTAKTTNGSGPAGKPSKPSQAKPAAGTRKSTRKPKLRLVA